MSNSRAAVIAALIVAAAAFVGCGGDSEDTDGGSQDGASTASTATSGSGTVVGASPTSAPTDEGSGENGTVTVDGTDYEFSVESCLMVNGRPQMQGSGEVTIVLTSTSLVVRIQEAEQYSVRDLQVSVSDETVTASGTGSNLAVANDLVEVELIAPCE